ncbi:uncharacterized protein [Drosophila takahashii]|uniref:uncharacterized protein n=1 Tax=Drosophila takahashii TaxID=29030 RepID=UPI003899020D
MRVRTAPTRLKPPMCRLVEHDNRGTSTKDDLPAPRPPAQPSTARPIGGRQGVAHTPRRLLGAEVGGHQLVPRMGKVRTPSPDRDILELHPHPATDDQPSSEVLHGPPLPVAAQQQEQPDVFTK